MEEDRTVRQRGDEGGWLNGLRRAPLPSPEGAKKGSPKAPDNQAQALAGCLRPQPQVSVQSRSSTAFLRCLRMAPRKGT